MRYRRPRPRPRSASSVRQPRARLAQQSRSFLPPVRIELRKIGPEILDLLLVLDAGKHHFGSGDLGFRVLDVVRECNFIPGEPRIPVRFGVAVVFDCAGFPTLKAIECGTNFVFCILADGVADRAPPERLLARGDVLRRRCIHRAKRQADHEYESSRHCASSSSKDQFRSLGRWRTPSNGRLEPSRNSTFFPETHTW